MRTFRFALLLAALSGPAWSFGGSTPIHDLVLEEDNRRIATVDRLIPSVVCVYDENQRGGGSGVIISPEGYGLTNFHVVAGMLPAGKGLVGLSDGRLRPMQILGIDPTGDIAMFRIESEEVFSAVELGDSDRVSLGDRALAMGNPFVLSEDYTPSVTAGIVTGLGRYQKGSGNNLVYSDCIQVDASINPGNSGGPLFSYDGKLIGINGRISVNARGRLNVGLGYAISINQIRRFLPTLRAGLVAKHGTLQANVEQVYDEVVFSEVLRYAPAYNAGVRVGNQLLAIDNIPMQSPNHFASVMGAYPADWPVLLSFRGETLREGVARLEPFDPKIKAFQIQHRANERQIARVLQGYRRFVGVDGASASFPKSWTTYRERDDDAASLVVFEVEVSSNQTVVRNCAESVLQSDMATFNHGGGDDHDGHSAPSLRMSFAPGRKEGSSADLEAQLYWQSVAMMVTTLLRTPDAADLAVSFHAGGNAMMDLSTAKPPPGRRLQARAVEMIRRPVGKNGIAAYWFDERTFELLKIVVVDDSADIAIECNVIAYEQVDGLRLPSGLDVRVGSITWRDSLENWRLVP